MKTITLPTSPEIRAAFAKLGLTLSAENKLAEYWDYEGECIIRLAEEPEFYQPECLIPVGAQILQILGLLPPPDGMVMIPREAARLAATAMWFTKYSMNRAADRWDEQGNTKAAEDYRRKALKANEAVMAIREALIGTPTTPKRGTEV